VDPRQRHHRRDAEETGLAAGCAAPRVRASSRATRAVGLRRFPLAPAELSLFRNADRLVVRDVAIDVFEGHRAAAHSSPGSASRRYEVVATPVADTRRVGGLSLD